VEVSVALALPFFPLRFCPSTILSPFPLLPFLVNDYKTTGGAALDLGRLNALNLGTLNALADLHRAGADSLPTPPLHPDDFAHVMR